MLKILKAELSYSRYWIIRVLGILPPLVIYFYLLNRWWINGIIIIGGLMLAAVHIKIRFKEERLRLETLLPVSKRKIAFARLVFSTLPVTIVYGLSEVIDIIPQTAWDGLRGPGTERLMFFALTIFLLFVYHIISDLLASIVYKSRAPLMEIFKSVVAGIILVLGAVAVSSAYVKSEDAGLNMIKIVFLIDFILAWISVRSFHNRKSFYNN